MHRVVSAFVALAILGSTATAASAQQLSVPLNGAPAAVADFTIHQRPGPTQNQLGAAILTLQDLGSNGAGFTVHQTGPVTARAVNVTSTLVRETAGQGVSGVLSVALTDANLEPPAVTARDYVAELTEDGRSGQSRVVAAPAIGRDAVRYEFIVWKDGRAWYGNTIAWRHGDTTAMVAMVSGSPSEPAAATLEFAQRQQRKVAAVFP